MKKLRLAAVILIEVAALCAAVSPTAASTTSPAQTPAAQATLDTPAPPEPRIDKQPAALPDCSPTGPGQSSVVLPPYAGGTARRANQCLAELAAGGLPFAADLRFLGMWEPEAIELVLTAVARYERLLGSARLHALIGLALEDGGGGAAQLTFVRRALIGAPAAELATARGQITLNDSLFDTGYLSTAYIWPAFSMWRTTAPQPVDVQDAIVAHELGHVMVRALRAEQAARARDGPGLEALYSQAVDPAVWPHPDANAEENLATECALLAMGLTRPLSAWDFQRYTLGPALEGSFWASASQ